MISGEHAQKHRLLDGSDHASRGPGCIRQDTLDTSDTRGDSSRMDPWEAGLARLEDVVRGEIGTLRGEIRAVRDHLRGEVGTSRDELRGEIQASAAETRQYIDEKVGETRRHFGVLVEHGRSELRAVAESVIMANENHERFREEVRERFDRVEHRLLRLETRLPGPAAR
jgi:hypothetical protein